MSENAENCVYGGRFGSRNDCIADAMRHGYLSSSAPTDALTHVKDLHGKTQVTPFLHRLLTS